MRAPCRDIFSTIPPALFEVGRTALDNILIIFASIARDRRKAFLQFRTQAIVGGLLLLIAVSE
jgi:hypothetical protein